MNQQQHAQLRSQFPALAQEVNGHPLIYLDNAATTQKPQAVLDAIAHYYRADNANVHRAAHALSGRATRAFEAARETVARFINAPRSHEVIWTRGTTEAINLVAQSWGMSELKVGDEIVLSTLEHHANIVPWQLIAERTGAVIRVIPLDKRGDLDMEAYLAMLGSRTRLVSVAHVSNALGTVNPVTRMVAAAKAVGALTLIDGAQAVAHLEVDVQTIGCDFYAFSGHKLYGPTGIGVLWERPSCLSGCPLAVGGEMIDRVSFSGTTFNTLPFKFEAGTPILPAPSASPLPSTLSCSKTETHWHSMSRDSPTIWWQGCDRCRACTSSVNPVSVLAPSPSCWTDPPAGCRHPARHAGHSAASRPSLRHAADGQPRYRRHPAGLLACYNNRDDVEALLAALHKLSDFF